MASEDKPRLVVPSGGEPNGDDYTASIELSNACREFYRNRVEATHSFKQRMSSRHGQVQVKRTTIDDAMDKLRNEMASLMDQDLSLMKQLLKLNEAIEDLKVKRLYHVSKDSLRASSQELHASDWSVSETDMFDSEDEINKKHMNLNERISSRSISVPTSSLTSVKSDIRRNSIGTRNIARKADVTVLVNGAAVKVHHGQQSSLDSGYGDDESYMKLYRGPIEVNL